MHEQTPNQPQDPSEQPLMPIENAQEWLNRFDQSELPNSSTQYDIGEGAEEFQIEDAVNRRNEDGTRTPIVVLKRSDGSTHDVDVTEYLNWVGLKNDSAESNEALSIKTGLAQVEKLGELSLSDQVSAPAVTESILEANTPPTPEMIEQKTIGAVVQVLEAGAVQLERAAAIREEFSNSAGQLRNIATDAQQPLRVLRNAVNNPRDIDARQVMNAVRSVSELIGTYGRIKNQGEGKLSDSRNHEIASGHKLGSGVEMAAEQSKSIKAKNPDESGQATSKNLHEKAVEVSDLSAYVRQITSQDKSLAMLKDLPGAQALSNVAYELEATLRRNISSNLPLHHSEGDIRRLVRSFGQIEEFSQMYLATNNRHKTQVREAITKINGLKEKLAIK